MFNYFNKFIRNKFCRFLYIFFICSFIQTHIFAMEEKPEFANVVMFISYIEYMHTIDKPMRNYFKQAVKANCAIIMIGETITPGYNFHEFKFFYSNPNNNRKLKFSIILPKQNSPDDGESTLKKYGFNLNDESFEKDSSPYNYSSYMSVTFNEFSEMVPDIIEKIFSINHQPPKIVWVMGHGQADDYIAKLHIQDFAKLLSILEEKNTKITWVTSCFFGGKNLKAIQDHLNEKKSQMIVLSQATSEIRTYYSLVDFDAFFQGCKKYFDKTRSLKESRQYFAEVIIPAILNCKEHSSDPSEKFDSTEQRILSIPTVRIPSNGDSDFYSLASLVIDSELINEKKASNEPIVVENQEVIFIDVPEVTVPIIIIGRLPIIILATHKFDSCSFEKITVTIKSNHFKNFSNFFEAFKGEIFGDDINFYGDSPRKINFLIKCLIFQAYDITLDNKLFNYIPRISSPSYLNDGFF